MADEEAKDTSAVVPPAAEESVPTPAEVKANPSNPIDHLREQAIALVPEESRAQMASLIRSIVDLYSPTTQANQEEPSPRVRARFSMLPVKPKITKEEGQRVPDSYDFFKTNED